jgi:hypothetical protein
MDSRSAHLKRPSVLAAVMLVAAYSFQVQCAPLQPGQAICFSTPRNDTVSSNMPSLSPQSLEALDFSKSSDAPLPLDFNEPPVDTPSLSVPMTISPAEKAQLQVLSDRSKNWILLTPEEILGATTPEKILGIQEHDSAGQPKNLTAMERYTKRQNQMLAGNTNAFQNGDSSPAWDFSRNRRDQSDVFNPINGGLKKTAFMENTPLNSGPDNRTLPWQNQNGDQSKLFDSPMPLPAPNAAQQLNLERFRQLLGSIPSPSPGAIPSSKDKMYSLPELSPDVKLGQPSLNPIGVPFTPLNSGVGKPVNLPTLPGAWGLSYTSSRPASVWAPQPPPWMSADQQPFAVPQRKF